MNETLSELLAKIDRLEDEIEGELVKRRAQFQYTLHDKTIRFEEQVLDAHRALRKGLGRFLFDSGLASYLTSPFIYAVVIPIALLDLLLGLYQAVCFPVYGIPFVRRDRYIVLDRHHLAYLNAIEKLNCVYCGYANGVIAYAREVASRTEQYWCPIKHARRVASPHRRYHHFLEFGDGEGYRRRLQELREAVRAEGQTQAS